MTDFLATRADVVRALDGSPPRPLSPVASGLAGWRRTGAALELCAECAGRILSRFFGCGALRGWEAVTEPEGVHCCGCSRDTRPCATVPDAWIVLRDGREHTRGTETECVAYLHRVQSCSVHHATRYEGWTLRRAER